MIQGLIAEICNDGRICMAPKPFMMARNLLLGNIDERIHAHFSGEKKDGSFCITVGADGKMATDYIVRGDEVRYYANHVFNPDDQFVSMVNICGPMTRGGDECTYGSIDIRNQIMRAADYQQCRGHIVYINTGGGLCSCLPDYRMAFNYARARGQKVFMLIDGACYSCGAFTGAMSDGIYFTNPEDGIGSLGMYMAFFTLADGTKNAISGETYHEYYAAKSKHKNEWYRKAAEGDMSLVEEETNRDLDILLANLKSDRPSITDEQMEAGEYKVKDVIGTLVDGQATVQQLAQMLIDDYAQRQGAPVPLKEAADFVPSEPDKNDPQDPDNDNPENEDANASLLAPHSALSTSNSINTMKQYTAIPAAIGEEPMETLDGELTLQAQQAGALEQVLAAGNNRAAMLEAQLAQLRTQMQEAETAHAAAIEQLNTEHAAAIEQLNAQHGTAIEQAVTEATAQLNTEHAAAVEQLNTQHTAAIEQLNTEHTAAVEQAVAEATAQLNTQHAAAIEQLNTQHQQALDTANQRIADLSAEVEQLNAAAGSQPQAGQPDSNGQQSSVATTIATSCAYNPSMSAKEYAAYRRQQGQA